MAARQLWLRTLIDALHSLAAGLVPGAAAALWLVRTNAQAALDPVALANLVRTWTPVLLVPLCAIVLLVVTGLMRLSHHTVDVPSKAMGPKSRAALAEHAVFVLLLASATTLIFSLIQP